MHYEIHGTRRRMRLGAVEEIPQPPPTGLEPGNEWFMWISTKNTTYNYCPPKSAGNCVIHDGVAWGQRPVAPDEFASSFSTQQTADYATLSTPKIEPTASETAQLSPDQQCQGLLYQWVQENPEQAACLGPADMEQLFSLCKKMVTGQVTPQFAAGAAAALVDQRCKEKAGDVTPVPNIPPEQTPPGVPPQGPTTTPSNGGPAGPTVSDCEAQYDNWAQNNPDLARCLTGEDIDHYTDLCIQGQLGQWGPYVREMCESRGVAVPKPWVTWGAIAGLGLVAAVGLTLYRTRKK